MSENNLEGGKYEASNIEVLEGLSAVRRRPAMYIGDTGTRGLHHLVFEALDNAVDEHLAGFCKNITVTIYKDGYVSVEDDGRGIPIENHPIMGKSALEVVMTVLHSGSKFNRNTYKVSGGLHGVGISCVNALSEHFIAIVWRDGKEWKQEYKKGLPITPVEAVAITQKRGTFVKFIPDPTIFKDTTFSADIIEERLRELSYLNPSLKLTLINEKNSETPIKEFYSKGGIRDALMSLRESSAFILNEPIYFSTQKENIEISVAFNYENSFSENIHSYANTINTREGGTHVTGFRKAISRCIKTWMEKNGILEKEKIELEGTDFREGLLAIIAVLIPEPEFEGQTKTKLGNPEVAGIVEQLFGEFLSQYLEEHPKEAKIISEKVLLNAKSRLAAKKAKELVQRKGALTGGGLPGKLSDCLEKDPAKCELFIVEGDSAGGSAKQARDRNTQAVLPLRGKILNVEKANPYKIFQNEEIKNLYQALGVSIKTNENGVGEDANGNGIDISKLRYHKIIIMCDADVDGSHITTLLLTFFFRYMRKLIELGYIYVAMPPLYLIKNKKGNLYAWNDKEKEEIIKDLEKNNISYEVQRYKGLGEMNPEQLWETTMNPKSRRLKQLDIESAAEADRLFSILMGEDVEPRKKFIEEHAHFARLDV